MYNLPTGTVTFLFTDVEGSTRLWEQAPEAMRLALARHDALAADVIAHHDGVLVRPRGEGDSLFAVFARATDAVAAACSLQIALSQEPWPSETPLVVRMALHTGEGELRDGDFYGRAVNRCARIRAAANGGQVLLSRATCELVRDSLPQGAGLLDLGERKLRDLKRPEHLFQLIHPALTTQPTFADTPPPTEATPTASHAPSTRGYRTAHRKLGSLTASKPQPAVPHASLPQPRIDPEALLMHLRGQSIFSGCIAHVEHLAQHPPAHAEVPGGLHPAVQCALEKQGITHLYTHQAEAVGAVRAGHSVVVVTGTASGKTLCYTIPAVEALARDPDATALFLFPTKALAQDQLRALNRFQSPEEGLGFAAGTYDGDTPQSARRKLRDGANILLTNPDMLHQGILPQHSRWVRFLAHLKYVVIDEMHMYRGVFGSHVANVMRRLRRICQHYGSSPQFICCSATIGNPQAHAEQVVGQQLALIDRDGSPRGPKWFVLWNPPPLEPASAGSSGSRRSSLNEATHLMASLVKDGIQTIAFVRTRLGAELLFRDCRDMLRASSPHLADSVQAYRGGYLPAERREIERRLADREILGIASTNALELGIDIHGLNACILVGYPGSIASLWQQAGRAGRELTDAVVFLIAGNSPVDQYLMSHPEYIFRQSPEQAVVDPDNPFVVIDHIRCAARELALSDEEAASFGPYAEVILNLLQEDASVRYADGRWYWARSEAPAAQVSLRSIAGPVYAVQDDSAGGATVGTMDAASALSQLHDGAVYLHAGDTYLVTRLDLQQRTAHVEKQDVSYYTQAVQVSQIQLESTEEEVNWQGCSLGFGEATVTTATPAFRKIQFNTREALGYGQIDLPPQQLRSVAFWLSPPEGIARSMHEKGLSVEDGLAGIGNVIVDVASLYVMCDPTDVGAVVDTTCLGREALFLYDRYPGGMGYARRCLDHVGEILQAARAVIEGCNCEDGCPSCVGPASPSLGASAPHAKRRKAAARFILQAIFQNHPTSA